MNNPMFKVGDRVRLNSTGEIGIVKKAEHEPAIDNVVALIDYAEGGSRIDKSASRSERWIYRVDGFLRGGYYSEAILESAQPCPNCAIEGWDWIVGCSKCGLTPEDRK